jgi:hypothetical protein
MCSTHCEDQLEGSGPAVPAGGYGDVGLWEPGILHRERGGRHRLHLHSPGTAWMYSMYTFLQFLFFTEDKVI